MLQPKGKNMQINLRIYNAFIWVVLAGIVVGLSGSAYGKTSENPIATDKLRVLFKSQNVPDINELRALIDDGADVNVNVIFKKIYVFTPLFLAAEAGYTEILAVLLKAGADVNFATDGDTPLMIAAENGHSEIVKLLLKTGADVNASRETGSTPLYLASLNDHSEIVKLLLKAGADVNASHENGFTPLYQAVQEGYIEIVKLLLKADVDVDAADTYGLIPLLIAQQNGNYKIQGRLLEAKNGGTPLMMAAAKGHSEIVKLLLKAGANIHAKVPVDGRDYTPLDIAQTMRHRDIVKILKEHGAK